MIVKENCNTKEWNTFEMFNKDNKLIYGAIMVIRDIIFISIIFDIGSISFSNDLN
jgi:hypothetical protein